MPKGVGALLGTFLITIGIGMIVFLFSRSIQYAVVAGAAFILLLFLYMKKTEIM